MFEGFGRRLNDAAGRRFGDRVPPAEDLPWYVAPLPDWLEEFGLRIAWVVVLVNLAGTAFGFYYYSYQFTVTDPVMWPFVPDSPLATLFIALSLALWRLGHHSETISALAFFGCLKLGAWTPFVLLVFPVEYPSGSLAALGALGFGYEYGLYAFLVTSHLAMVVQAFLIHRYADFSIRAVAVALLWYGLNDVVDYFVPIVGEPHHTILGAEFVGTGYEHTVQAHDVAAAAAVVLTMLALFLALSTRVEKLKSRESSSREPSS